MERLIVDNFLNLKHIKLDVAKINIIIGRQAQGKSVLAKLVCFFQQLPDALQSDIWDIYDSRFKSQQGVIDYYLTRLFKKIFPEYSWKNQNFTIVFYYSTDNMYIKISNVLNKNENSFSFDFCDTLYDFINNLFPSNDLGYANPSLEPAATYQTRKDIKNFLFSHNINNRKIIFIPSARSFFASTIYKNIFYFVSKDIEMDYFSKKLGAVHEKAKNHYLDVNSDFQKEPLEINKVINKILKGDYLQESEQDWIIHKDNRKIRLSDASSGQQEALPITLILSVLPFLEDSQPYHFFIEEPEAHLFPDAQKYMVELFSLVFNLTKQKNGFFITTHSPYILSAFNNLIQAGNARKKIAEKGNKKEALKKLFSIVPEDKILNIEDFGVYTLENGELTSIIEEENRLIDTNIIDEAYDEFFDIFGKLTDLEFEE